MRTKTRKVTDKRLAANRAAAQKSTGPKSAEGKQRAAFNSFEHGAFASEPHILQQALERAGGAGELDALRQSLAADWRPQSAQQRLLVDDLAWLYWLRDRTRLALLERQARHRATAELERDQRRFDARHRPLAVDHDDFYPDGCALLPSSQEKIDTMSGFLDEISLLITQGHWSDRPPKGHAYAVPALLVFLYGQTPATGRGKKLKDLWNSCTIPAGPDYVPSTKTVKPLPDDPRIAVMQALIDEERAALVEEAELARRACEIEVEQPEDPAWPVLQPLDETWKETVGRLEKLDRQINAKIRLLLRLEQRAASASPESVPSQSQPVEASLDPASAPPNRDVGPGFTPAITPDDSNPDRVNPGPTALAPDESNPAVGAHRKNHGTNPNDSDAPLESTNAEPPEAAPVEVNEAPSTEELVPASA
jgi:hypothetical protein